MAQHEANFSVLLERLNSLIYTKLPQQEAVMVEQLAQRLYRNISLEDLAGRSDSDLYGGVMSLWHLMQSHDLEHPSIEVFNPEVASHGWHSNHTIIELIQQDTPFMVDSLRMALKRLGITAHLLLNAPLSIEVKDGEISALQQLDANAERNITAFHVEIDRQTSESDRHKIAEELASVFRDVALAVADWMPMQTQLQSVLASLESAPFPGNEEERHEAIEFLAWVKNHNFTLMGYREYKVEAVKGDHILSQVDGSSLGLMRSSHTKRSRNLSSLPTSARENALDSSLLVLTKTNSKSRVHRPAYIDYIGIKQFDGKGKVIGEHRFIGLYAASVYNQSATQVPLIRNKLERVMAGSGYAVGSHAYKALLNILETYPRDELLQSPESELLNIGLGVLQMQERDMTRLFVRRDLFGRFFSCMVYVPKERYNTLLRQQTQSILKRYFNSVEPVEFTTFFSESVLARTHYIVHVKDNTMDIDVKQIEQNLIEAARSWEDKFQDALLGQFGEEEGKRLHQKYADGFPRGYKDDVLPGSVLADIEQLERLTEQHRLGMLFYRAQEEKQSSKEVRLKLYHQDLPLHLSDILPLLENMGLRVIGERPYKIRDNSGLLHWVLEFHMAHTNEKPLDISKVQGRFVEALSGVWDGIYENDGFNRLILSAGLTGRQVSMLRAYAKYMRQIGSSFSQQYIEETLSRYPAIARQLLAIFETKFSPAIQQRDLSLLLIELEASLESVSSLDDDRIIRRYAELVEATLRTNYYQALSDGRDKTYISFKLSPEHISDVPLPLPRFEVFIYSPRVEGVHLRGGKVARGGLRWSDRREDFRTEVLGLVKAQQVKNTVIVPVGAKGGFVCKKLPGSNDREAFLAEGQACYRTFIRGLLDITDNVIEGKVIPPSNVVRHDEDDTYLVVAADKGTATFSDIANEISAQYDFWLGDAFASGGSVGYDHKKMGITARGAWESVKRHFREIGVDCQQDEFTCVGVGDMAGDVFGNGMLLSDKTRLIAAFNHQHIFIDPAPDAASSFAERTRLFHLARSSWSDYNQTLISKGGGIFERSAKAIPLSAEIQTLLGSTERSLTPTELIKQLLQMPVDLLWNGGIGTYIKSEAENNSDVGDRANDAVRVNGQQVKAKIVGEGGNLGATQLGRIEYAAKGGRVNTDFTDNVGGVDCSDNEVNIKILLNTLVNNGDLTVKQRNKLLYEMTDDVSRIVLDNCYRQTQGLSVSQLRDEEQVKEYQRFIHAMEREGLLDRNLEFLPNDEELAERLLAGKGLTRPELCVLLAYGKMYLKERLLVPEVTDVGYHNRSLVGAFPAQLQKKYKKQMQHHPLRAEIIATQIANALVDDVGFNFVGRLQDETGASEAEIANCYTMAREVFQLEYLWQAVSVCDNKIPAIVQSELLFQMRRIIRRATRWFLRHRDRTLTIEQTIKRYQPTFDELRNNLAEYLIDDEVAELSQAISQLEREGLPTEVATHMGQLSTLFSALDIAEVVIESERPITLVADVYFKLGARLDLHWFLKQISEQPVSNHWQALARASFREELDWQQRALSIVVLRYCSGLCEPLKMLDTWFTEHEKEIQRWFHMLGEFRTSQSHEFAKFSVALRELMLLSHNCEPK
ncbi:NAD-glutamate dehydrogenase [Corallincola holothuriorum]|uniref:NAD-glutamate dehydrogenase n=1 Tax=Corallincola holothuriorum TaxID=2282215 RepID=A0A368NSI4_9GAMM|nr:NAD-glutamate dehydrogenase [Corallincola holothuriorum]RCU52664.1 NAD-glutamate dehydrogenase [Corallincola holothuriorum]